MARRARADTATAAVEIAAKVRKIEPPASFPLTADEAAHWPAIVAHPLAIDWGPQDLEIAAALARAVYRLKIETEALRSEESVVMSANGAPMANPRLRIVSDMHGQILRYRKDLGMHARATQGERRDVEKRLGHMATVRAGQQADDGIEGLLN